MDFYVGEDDWLPGVIYHRDGFLDSLCEGGRVTLFMDLCRGMMLDSEARHHVARKLDVNGPLVAQHGMKDAIDLLKRCLRIAQDGRGYCQLLEDAPSACRTPALCDAVVDFSRVPLSPARR